MIFCHYASINGQNKVAIEITTKHCFTIELYIILTEFPIGETELNRIVGVNWLHLRFKQPKFSQPKCKLIYCILVILLSAFPYHTWIWNGLSTNDEYKCQQMSIRIQCSANNQLDRTVFISVVSLKIQMLSQSLNKTFWRLESSMQFVCYC